MIKKNIVFTGGGSAGHVTPNLPLIECLKQDQWIIDYIGSVDGVEKSIIQSNGISYHAVRSGKLRRYFSWKNFSDPFNLLVGIVQSYCLLRQIKPSIVYSKGGFVGLPVVIAAWLNRIPIIAHESDMTPGLANRLSFPFVSKICVTFAQSKSCFKNQDKVEVTGTPIRSQLLSGDKKKGLTLCGFTSKKNCIMVIGGSQGSNAINAAVRSALPILCQHFQVIHLCGKGKLDSQLINQPGYYQFEYVDNELADLYAASDIIISRSGANSLYEILALGKPHILIPLPLKSSRGDQIHNARFFESQGISLVIDETVLTPDSLVNAVNELVTRKVDIISKIKELNIQSATSTIIQIINQHTVLVE